MNQEANGLLTMRHELNVPLGARGVTTSGRAFAGAALPLADEGLIVEHEGSL